MSNKPSGRGVVFKPYVQDQGWLFPPTIGELIPAHHKVRLINEAIDGMDLDKVLSTYKGGGTSSYHPKMLLKILVYGYVEKVYSSRMLEKACHENICFMWLSGNQRPDHNTINSFRKHRLSNTVKEVFAQVLLLLVEQGYVQLKDYYIDGTKMESVANRYSFVWAKNVARYKASVLEKVAQILAHIDELSSQEDSPPPDSGGPGTKTDVLAEGEQPLSDSKAVREAISRINSRLDSEMSGGEDTKPSKSQAKQKRLADKLQKDHLPKLEGYEQQERLLGGRSSYSKTDVDATFMRTKDDHLGNGQLRPCYNLQVGTEQQFIVNYTVHQTASDISCFVGHMDDTLRVLNNAGLKLPDNVCADAGYGSEQNYEYLEEKGIEAYVKYPGYHKEQKGKHKHAFPQQALHYNEEGDYFVCPMGQHMHQVGQTKEQTKTGYVRAIHIYEAQNCEGCPLRGQCFKAKAQNRAIKISHKTRQYRQKAKERLQSLKGQRKKVQRNIDVEAVFGHIKQDRGFKRFMLQGLKGVNVEMGLLAIANNFTKWHNLRRVKRIPMPGPHQPDPNTAQIALEHPSNALKMVA